MEEGKKEGISKENNLDYGHEAVRVYTSSGHMDLEHGAYNVLTHKEQNETLYIYFR